MLSDTKTLYKLMTLYMLRQVSFPLTGSQLTDFFVSHEYTNYFTLQDIFSELLESGLIVSATVHNSVRYEITHEGDETLGFFGNKISSGIIDDMNTYIKENRFKMRSEVGTTADYYMNDNQEYILRCEVMEGKSTLIGIDLTLLDKSLAETMSNNWKSKSQEIYSYILKKLAEE